MVAVQNQQGDLSPVANDTEILLTPSIGRLSASSLTIHPGEASNFNAPIVLTSTQAGTDSVLAMSGLGKGTAQVVYQMPQASQLHLAVGGSEFDVNGSGVRKATVCLEDDGNNFVAAGQEVQVTLQTTVGGPSFMEVPIAANSFCSKEVKFSSRAAAKGSLTAASVMGLKTDQAEISFPPFPWYLVWLAAAGGVIGTFVASYSAVVSASGLSRTLRNLLVGAVCGGFAYLFACFGALVLPDGVPVVLQNIPTASKVGALLIGFVGGLLWRKIWKFESADAPAGEKKAA
jgi:hypothetical protein